MRSRRDRGASALLSRRPLYRALRIVRVVAPAMLRYRTLEKRDARGPSQPEAWTRNHERLATGLARLGEDLGGVMIKFCQVAGARADVLPAPFLRELGRFHDRVTPRPWSELAPFVESELARPLAAIFSSIDPEPVAAASLAQVHRARLRDGESVAIKIQYPEAERLYRSDLALVRSIVALASRLFPGFPLREAVLDVAHFIALELDFEREAASTERVRRALAGDPSVVVPRLHAGLSTRRLLVLEFLDGTPIHETARLEAEGFDLRSLADRIADLYRRMLFEDGFFHGDPHPGNLLVLRDGRIGLLDFGLAKELPEGFGEGVARLLGAASRGDRPAALRAAREIGFRIESGDPDAFARLLAIVLGARHDLAELRSAALGSAVDGVPPDIALVFRTLVLLNGLSERLAPGERRIPLRILSPLVAPPPAPGLPLENTHG